MALAKCHLFAKAGMLCAAAAAFAVMLPAPAHAEDRTNLWLASLGSIRIDDDTGISATMMWRSASGSMNTAGTMEKIGLEQDIGGGFEAAAAYSHYNSNRTTGNVTEHRLTQEMGYNFGGPGSINLNARVRLEERMIEDETETGYRLRPKMTWSSAISRNWRASGGGEAIFSLNRTEWGQQAGINSFRLESRMRRKLSGRFGISSAYIFMRGLRRDEPDYNSHVMMIALDSRF